MSHDETLKLLFPLDLGGDHAADRAVEAASLDAAHASAQTLLQEMLPLSAYMLIERWERLYGLPVNAGDPLQVRQGRIAQKMRELGRLDRGYFVQLAAGLGYAVTIEELSPFMAGWSGAGDELGDDASDWCWRAWYTEADGTYSFRAGSSAAGECLSYSFITEVEQLFLDLKPADTFVEFTEY